MCLSEFACLAKAIVYCTGLNRSDGKKRGEKKRVKSTLDGGGKIVVVVVAATAAVLYLDRKSVV